MRPAMLIVAAVLACGAFAACQAEAASTQQVEADTADHTQSANATVDAAESSKFSSAPTATTAAIPTPLPEPSPAATPLASVVEATKPLDAQPGTSGAKPELQVLQQGAEPRTLLRYDISAGCTENITIEQEATTQVAIDGFETDTTNLESRVVIGRTTESHPDGIQTISEVLEVETEDPSARFGEGSLAIPDITGLRVTRIANEQGDGLGTEVDSSEPGQMGAEWISVATNLELPTVPIGVGGRYQKLTNYEIAGSALQAVTEYIVQSIDEQIVTIEFTAEYQVDSSALDEALGDELEVTDQAAFMSGTAVLDLRRAAPIELNQATVSQTAVSWVDGAEYAQELTVLAHAVSSDPQPDCRR